MESELSERQIYRLIQRLRESGGELTALLPGGSLIDGDITIHYSPAEVGELVDAVEKLT